MANWIKSLHADLHRDEDGKITLVAGIMMLAMGWPPGFLTAATFMDRSSRVWPTGGGAP